jgi:DHA1 family multidrug resistance protein-like MFS transporter
MIGYGLTLPVLAFYIERLALAEGASEQNVFFHVGLLTGIFSFMQFFFAPLWGKLSDRIGRRPLFIIGLGGYAIFMAFLGMGTNLFMLYSARILGGVLSAAVLPAASAYVTDVTSETERGKGMALLNSTIGLGVVVGPALGAMLSRLDWHLEYRFGHFDIDDFSTPFFVAAFLAVLALIASLRLLPESKLISSRGLHLRNGLIKSEKQIPNSWQFVRKSLWGLLKFSFLSFFALSLFEGTFALHAQRVMNFGPSQMALVFIVCGLVMAAAQASVVGWLIGQAGEMPLLSLGFGLMGTALVLLMTTQNISLILFYVALFSLGMAVMLTALILIVTAIILAKRTWTKSNLKDTYT